MLWWLDYSSGKHDPNSISSRFCFPINVMCFDVVSHCVLSVCLVMDFGLFQWLLFALSAEIYTGYSMSCDFSVAFLWVSLSVTRLCCYPCLLFLHEFICTFTWCVLKWAHRSLSTFSLSRCWNNYTHLTALCSKYEHDILRSVILH